MEKDGISFMKTRKMVGILFGTFLWGIYAIELIIRTAAVIRGFGNEANAVDQSAQKLFNYFVLFESGMSAAYLYKMYEPMAVHDKNRIISLYQGLTKSMHKIAVEMFLACIPVAFIYAVVIKRETIHYISAMLIIFLNGCRFITPYLVSVSKKTILTLYGYKYIADIIDGAANSVIVLIELFLIGKTNLSIAQILCISCCLGLILGTLYIIPVRLLCGDIIHIKKTPSFEAKRMTKDILFHQVASLLNSNIDTILLSVSRLSLVTVYQAYEMILTYPVVATNKITENFRAELGVILKIDKKRAYALFQKMMAFHMFVAIVAVSVYVVAINPFIELWLGRQFTIGKAGVYLFAVCMVHRMIINVVYIVRDGEGLYAESKYFSVIEALMNLILSIILVIPFGIEGVMTATVLAVYLGLLPGNARLVFRDIFQKKNSLYLDYLTVILATVFSVGIWRVMSGGYTPANWKQMVWTVCAQAGIAVVIAAITVWGSKRQYLKRDGYRER